jgi:hypothetical protein
VSAGRLIDIGNVFIVVGVSRAPEVILLASGAAALYRDRSRVAGNEAAINYTFGHDAQLVFPANDTMLGYLMERAVSDGLPHADVLAQLAATLVLGKPLGNGRDFMDGPSGGERVPSKPRPKRPAPTTTAEIVQAA